MLLATRIGDGVTIVHHLLFCSINLSCACSLLKYDNCIDQLHLGTSDPNSQLPFWSTVAHKMNWRGPVSTLQQRFMKVYTMKGLSVREQMLLKKLFTKKQKDSKITWDSILYHFPGRTLDDLLASEDLPVKLNDLPQKELPSEKSIFKVTKIKKMRKARRKANA